MTPGDPKKPGDGSDGTDAQFDHSDDETPVEVKLPRGPRPDDEQPIPVTLVELRKTEDRRERDRRRSDLTMEALRAAHVDFGKRLSSLEERLNTIVDRLLDVAVSDQDHDEKIAELRRDFEQTREELHALREDLKGLKEYLEANRGP